MFENMFSKLTFAIVASRDALTFALRSSAT